MFKPIPPPASASRSRVRLSASIIQAAGWDSYTSEFEFYSWFRKRDELICLPIDESSGAEHPFYDIINIVTAVAAQAAISSLQDIPPLKALLAADRLKKCKGTWANEGRSQLDLNLGVEVTDRLGWSKQLSASRPIYVAAYGRAVLLISERRFLEAQEEDVTTS